jgi:hypothetical protein
MHQVCWHSETACVTVVRAHTTPRRERADRTTRGRSIARVGFALTVIVFPLLATGQGRALLTSVLGQHLPQARPRALGGRSGAPGLPARPG